MDKYIKESYLIDSLSVFNDQENGNPHFLNGIETAREIILNAPSIEIEEEFAYWIWKGPNKGYECSHCHGMCLLNYESDWHKSEHCPHCGKKMNIED